MKTINQGEADCRSAMGWKRIAPNRLDYSLPRKKGEGKARKKQRERNRRREQDIKTRRKKEEKRKELGERK